MKNYDCIIVGAGPAGIGNGICLKELGIENYLILEKGKIGESFLQWTKETKFISPSFTTNMFFWPDMNAVTPLSSPAFTFNKQHLSGKEYSSYLNILSKYHDLKIQENTHITEIVKNKNNWELKDQNKNIYIAKYLIWAGGEWSFPKKLFSNTIHTSSIKSYKDLKESEYLVIGSGESGVDFAFNLLSLGKKVTMIAENNIDQDNNSDDPSKKLSPVTVTKYDLIKNNKNFILINGSVKKIEHNKYYEIILENNKKVVTQNRPYEATGFERVPKIIQEFISVTGNDLEINNFDESKKTQNLFFVGPNIHRQNVILCFIYKFRMRLAVVGCEVAKRLKIEKNKIEKVKKFYKKHNMYLEDIHSCDINCEC